jgi:hypothetical protein
MKWKLVVLGLSLLALATSACCNGIGHIPGGEYIVPYTDTSFYVEPLSSMTLTIHAGAGATIG